MNRERTISITANVTIPDHVWSSLVAAVAGAGLAESEASRESLGDKVRAARIKRCLSREGLARRAGVSTNTIIRMEEKDLAAHSPGLGPGRGRSD